MRQKLENRACRARRKNRATPIALAVGALLGALLAAPSAFANCGTEG